MYLSIHFLTKMLIMIYIFTSLFDTNLFPSGPGPAWWTSPAYSQDGQQQWGKDGWRGCVSPRRKKSEGFLSQQLQ